MSKSLLNSAGLAALATLLLAACSQGNEAAAPPAAAPAAGGYDAAAFGAATVADADGVITATRSGEGSHGVSLTTEPALITFTVEGADTRVRVRQDGNWVNVPRSEQYALMYGRGGASAINAYTRSGDTVTVRVLSVVPCSQTQCAPAMGAVSTEE